jgi:DNA (cytosine-5)-methyltransferase 1
MEKRIRFAELFCGIGGFRYGLESVGGQGRSCFEEKSVTANGDKRGDNVRVEGGPTPFCCVWANDNDRHACQIYRRNYGKSKGVCDKDSEICQSATEAGGEKKRGGEQPDTPAKGQHGCPELHEGDITEVKADDIPDHDLLTAGFPCQAFSVAGKRGGFDDTRGTLFFEIARVCRAKRPRYILLENVKGLLSHESGKTFQTILKVLSDIGYVLQWEVLNSKNFGVPQNRERVFVVGHLGGTGRPEVFPVGGMAKENPKKVRRTQFDMSGKGYDSQQDRIYNPRGVMCCLPNANPDNKLLIAGCLDRDGYLRDGRRPKDRHGRSQLLPTGYRRIRRLTPIECERLQGFPDGWTEGASDTQRYKCLGNAVTTTVVAEIGKRLWTSFQKGKEAK